ncbi:hypothetical protein ACX8XP_14705 [Calditrichota bacterium LG25]
MDLPSYNRIKDLIADYCFTQNFDSSEIEACKNYTDELFSEAGMFVNINGQPHVKPVFADTILQASYQLGWISLAEKEEIKPIIIEAKEKVSVQTLMDSIDAMPIQKYIDNEMDYVLCFISIAQHSHDYWNESLAKISKTTTLKEGGTIVADGAGAYVGGVFGGLPGAFFGAVVSSVVYVFYWDCVTD